MITTAVELHPIQVALALCAGAAAVVCTFTWAFRRRGLLLLAGALAALIVGLSIAQEVWAQTRNDLDKQEIADKLGIDLRGYWNYKAFPASYFAEEAMKRGMSKEEVRRLTSLAVSRYACLNGRAEKVIFSHRSTDGMILNVWYTNGRMVDRAYPVDSADNVPIEDCQPS